MEIDSSIGERIMKMTNKSITRRSLFSSTLAGLCFMAVRTTQATAASFPAVTAYRNPGCGCCEKWTEQMKAAGFNITMEDDENLASRKAKLGVPEEISGCHTALIGDYVFEGHVPPDDIILFLTEKSDALGLAVPGMPMGSPGMESSDAKDAYDVLAMAKDGTWKVYASH
jgi:hypothetical protein